MFPTVLGTWGPILDFMLLSLVRQISQRSTSLLILSWDDKTKKVLCHTVYSSLSGRFLSLIDLECFFQSCFWNAYTKSILMFCWICVFDVTQNTVMHHKQQRIEDLSYRHYSLQFASEFLHLFCFFNLFPSMITISSTHSLNEEWLLLNVE